MCIQQLYFSSFDDQQITQLQQVGISLDIINNITHLNNRMDPALLQQLALQTNGNFHNLDLDDPLSKQLIEQYSHSFQYGEYGFDVFMLFCCLLVPFPHSV